MFFSMFGWVSDVNAWIALGTLVFLEIVLGIDNLIFLAIVIARLPESQRERARIFGISLAMLSRIALLVGLFWVMKLNNTLFHIGDFAVSGRDIVLFLGGVFLIYKATSEIHQMSEQDSKEDEN
ncbi:TerC family protein, partial [Helicobacter typhlonius]